MISIAILGAGRWGNHLIRNFLAQDRAQVAAIVDPSQEKLDEIRDRYALPPEIALLKDWRSILDPNAPSPVTIDLNAIVVATPAVTHTAIVEAALLNQLHVLAEKPLALTVQEAQYLTTLAQQQHRQLVIDHTYLFHGAVAAGAAAVAQLGTLRYGYATRTNLGPVRLDVDALWDLAIHDLAIFGQWLGELPCQVQAQGHTWLPNPGPSSQPSDDPGLADLVWAKLRYPSGMTVQCHWCWHNPDKQRRLALVGDQGTLIFDELAPQPLVLQRGSFQASADFPFVPTGLASANLDFDSQEPLAAVCSHFLDCVEANQPSPRSPGPIAVGLITILMALSQSLRNGGTWETVNLPSG
ncbi:MAG: Gfo/Idh/MocA family protein [Prochlorotrichaceae cyanobacterium]